MSARTTRSLPLLAQAPAGPNLTGLTLTVLVMMVLLAVMAGCTRQTEQTIVELTETPLLQNLPPATQGFLYWNFSSPEFQAYQKKSSAGGMETLWQKLMEQSGHLEGVQALGTQTELLGWAQKHGILISDPEISAPTVQSGVLLLEVKSDLPVPNLAMFLQTKSNSDAVKVLTELKQHLDKSKVNTEEVTLDNSATLRIPLKRNEDQGVSANSAHLPGAILARVQDNQLVFSTSEQLLRWTSTPGVEGQTSQLLDSPTFKQLEKKLNAKGDYSRLIYFDFDSLLDKIKGLTAMIPDEEAQKWLNSDQAPVRGMMAASWLDSRSQSFHSDGGISFSKEFLNSYAPGLGLHDQEQSISQMVPQQTALWLSISGALIKLGLEQASKDQAAVTAQHMETLGKLQSLGIALIPSEGAQLFPGISIVAQHSNASELLAELKKSLQAQQSQSPIPLSQWQTKQVDGKAVDYILSPLGLGLYLASSGDSVILSTNEDTLKKIFQTQAGKHPRLQSASTAPSLAEFYLNADGIARLIDSLQGSLSMFTGGQPLVSPDEIKMVRALGESSWALSYSDETIVYRSEHRVQ